MRPKLNSLHETYLRVVIFFHWRSQWAKHNLIKNVILQEGWPGKDSQIIFQEKTYQNENEKEKTYQQQWK